VHPQATSDKLARLETELREKTEELASQRRAMENSWQVRHPRGPVLALAVPC
jgi:hypothetical protein